MSTAFVIFVALVLTPGCTSQEKVAAEEQTSACPNSDPQSAAVLEDEDHDGLTNVQEGSSERTDSDGDSVPDSLDEDSDGDLLPDVLESGDLNLRTAAIDTDGDGSPDFRDADSDGDSLSDRQEGAADPDRDGLRNYRDLDSDSDGVPDEKECEDETCDSDGDGVTNTVVWDSDNDGLFDLDEVDRYGASPHKADTDGDGQLDIVEVVAGTNPLVVEVTPLYDPLYFVVPYDSEPFPARRSAIFTTAVQLLDVYFGFDESSSMNEEFAAMRNVASGLPSIIDKLRCPVDAQRTHCARDQDCSVGYACGPRGLCVTDPVANGCVPDIWTGVGTFGNLDSFVNHLSLQPDATLTADRIPEEGVPARSLGPDGPLDGPWAEAPYQVPACVADGDHCINENKGCTDHGLGCVGYRSEAVRVYIQISDADNQCADPVAGAKGTIGTSSFPTMFFGMGRCAEFDAETAGRELANMGIKFIGLYGNDRCDYRAPDCDNFPQEAYNVWVREAGIDRPLLEVSTPRSVPTNIGQASGSTDVDGRVFVYEALNDRVVRSTADAIKAIIRGVPLRLDVDMKQIDGAPIAFAGHTHSEDAVEAKGQRVDLNTLVQTLEVDRQTAGCARPAASSDSNGDGRDDAFIGVAAGTAVCWSLTPAKNLSVPGNDEIQVLRGQLVAYGDGSPLDQREVVFIIPPVPPTFEPAAPHRLMTRYFFDNGGPRYEVETLDGAATGREQWWDESGQLTRRCDAAAAQGLVECEDLRGALAWGEVSSFPCPLGSSVVLEQGVDDWRERRSCRRPDGRKFGPFMEWRRDGSLAYETQYENDEIVGVETWWSAAGAVERSCDHRTRAPTCGEVAPTPEQPK